MSIHKKWKIASSTFILSAILRKFRGKICKNKNIDKYKSFIRWLDKYRGFSPYATFGTWKKFALAKNRISKIFVLCTQ